ncbi:hypothetical protein [Pedobacter sp. Leaf132]|nr:hypothetical protein [Pedobacter sp. Leaf132]
MPQQIKPIIDREEVKAFGNQIIQEWKVKTDCFSRPISTSTSI